MEKCFTPDVVERMCQAGHDEKTGETVSLLDDNIRRIDEGGQELHLDDEPDNNKMAVEATSPQGE